MKVFISYSHVNRPICFQIAELMEKIDGVDLWYDKGLIPGEVYSKTIAEQLASTDVLVALISKDSVKSEWVKDEMSFAKDKRKKIIPIWLEAVELTDEFDLMIHRYHSIFWFSRSSDAAFKSELEIAILGVSVDQEDHFEGYGNEFSEKENEQIKLCLEKEKNEEFSYCYSAENALLLGKAYFFGGVVSPDWTSATRFLKIAQYFGSMDATSYLIVMELEMLGRDQEPDIYKQYIEELHELADGGSVSAKLFLGNAYWYGRYGLEASKEISASYYEECAKVGNARAQYIMASNYYEGDGVPQDYDLAIMYANLAVEQKYTKAWRRWGKFYRDGRAVPQDYEKAKKAYERGCQWGDYNCNNKIGDMYYYGWGFDVNYELAVSYYKKALEAPKKGHRYALRKAYAALGRCFELGHGVAKNLKTATDYYLLAYQNGDESMMDRYLACMEEFEA